MKQICILLLAGLVLLSGCASRYNIRLTNGTVVTSKGKPKLNEEGSAYKFTDLKGEKVTLPAGRVREIYPASEGSSSSTQFKTAPLKSGPAAR